MIVTFTGHRPNKLGGYGPSETQRLVRAAIRDALTTMQPACAYSGRALGLDQWAAETCVELGISFIAAVPFIGQESQWPSESQEHYRELLAKAHAVEVVSPGGYAAWKMQHRNKWMVDQLTDPADTLIAVWDGTSGGTANCVSYAMSRAKRIFRIDPAGLHGGRT